ncbi:MAG: ComF family protein [Candidatus Coatesbacteria bacterium]|nr:ComF family protein [Candidatus Coatesbacteria bacterium]
MIPNTRQLAETVAASLNALFGLALNSLCALCGKRSSAAICPGCVSTFERLESACCPKCGRPKFAPGSSDHARTIYCGECEERRIDRRKRWYFDRAVSLFLYEGRMREAILTLKYRRRFRIADVLGALFAQYFPHRLICESVEASSEFNVVIPVPLHISRLMEREFNQAAILARYVAEAMSLRVSYEVLERTRATAPQWTLTSIQQKIENVKGAFKVRRPKAIKDAKILLIDDIFTRGATANECAKTLMKAGAGSVVVGALSTPHLGHDTPGAAYESVEQRP